MAKMANQLSLPPPSTLEVLDPFGAGASLKRLTDLPVLFINKYGEGKPLVGRGSREGLACLPLTSVDDGSIIGAVDSSCARIAETVEGTVYAVRGSAVEVRRRVVTSCRRYGPFLAYIDGEMADELCRGLSSERALARLIIAEPLVAAKLLRIRLERLLQLELVKDSRVQILLVDGALKKSRLEKPPYTLDTLAQEAKEAGIDVVGISKTSRLIVVNQCMKALMETPSAPVYLDIHEELGFFSEGVVGRLLLAKFTHDGIPLRVDVAAASRKISSPLSRLLGGEAFYAGYPESLRLAHHLAVIREADRACIAGYMVRELSVRSLPWAFQRSFLLGRLPHGASVR